MPPKNKTAPTAPTTYIRFKYHRTTILLLTHPLTPLTTLIADLLSALHERYPDGLPSISEDGEEEVLVPLPTTPEEVELAVPNDPYDPVSGWKEVDWAAEEGGLKGLGVPEGGVLAFRVRGEEGWGVVVPRYDEEEEEMVEEGEEMEGREMEVVVGKGKGRARVEDSEGEDEL